ncbi:MAG TPA: 2-oxo acid dehydrogenase subunit E2 [Dehalococcoidia bacterium]|nr:2-oxo acid dehydrogenase subunit E2 [Dehalococcoidia bacterium]
MATSIVMPQMGYDMQQGTVVRWHKQEGDAVARGDVLADIETDKATVEFEAFVSGVLRKIVAQEGIAIPVGDLIAVITGPDEALPEGLLSGRGSGNKDDAPVGNGATSVAAQPVSTVASAPPAASPGGEVRASPIARRLAREQGIDLAVVTGTGPGGRIVEKDVLNHTDAGAQTSPVATAAAEVRASPIARRLAREGGIELALVTGTGPGGRIVEQDVLNNLEAAPQPSSDAASASAQPEQVDLSRMRQTIAKVTSDSKRDTPHFYVSSEVDMTKATEMRGDLNEVLASESRVSVNDLVVKACAMALQKFPKFNAFYQGGHLQMNPDINIGIAIALESGLIVPGINGCQAKSLVEIAAASRDLIARAHSGTLRNEEYSGTTFSVSNLGMFDVDSFTAIIYPPHAAILAVGRVKEQAVARDGQVTVAQIMTATLSVDHRVADGAEAARFIMEIKGLLEKPAALII